MRTIYKYPIEITDTQTLEVPQDRRILNVQMQDGKPCIWMEVETDTPHAELKVYVVGTGHPMPKTDLHYIGSVQIANGLYVFHVFWA